VHPNGEVVEGFYRAFRGRDGDTMAAAYHPEARFSDPVFDLQGAEIGDMWRMLCAAKGDLEVSHSDVRADDETGSARWEARYLFGGRPVHNRIEARFGFRDGLIIEHRDEFDFPRWAAQALGLPGRVLGRSGWLRRRVRADAATRLTRFRGTAPNP
jgi:hypothetical protein